jgi:nicotinate-nucleotide adenylyltransferase
MRIAVLGGSFDPIHHGHLVVGSVTREILGADHVRLVPTAEQPFKLGQHHAPATDRARMVELATANDPGFVVDRCELGRPGPSYTVDTMADVRRRFPGAQLSLLLGSDTAELFPQWRDPAGIRAQAEIVVFARSGESLPSGIADRVVAVPRIDISSTAIRERVRRGASLRYWVPDAVAGFIAERGLYRD